LIALLIKELTIYTTGIDDTVQQPRLTPKHKIVKSSDLSFAYKPFTMLIRITELTNAAILKTLTKKMLMFRSICVRVIPSLSCCSRHLLSLRNESVTK